MPSVIAYQISSSVCYTKASERISVSVDYGANGIGTGTWSITGNPDAMNVSGIFNPQANGEISDSYTITYKYTDGKGCVNQNNRTIDVIYLSAPETQPGHNLLNVSCDTSYIRLKRPIPRFQSSPYKI